MHKRSGKYLGIFGCTCLHGLLLWFMHWQPQTRQCGRGSSGAVYPTTPDANGRLPLAKAVCRFDPSGDCAPLTLVTLTI